MHHERIVRENFRVLDRLLTVIETVSECLCIVVSGIHVYQVIYIIHDGVLSTISSYLFPINQDEVRIDSLRSSGLRRCATEFRYGTGFG